MKDFEEILKLHKKKSNRTIASLPDRELKEYAIALYLDSSPVDEILTRTGLTRTRMYNALRRSGINPNRQGATGIARSEDFERTAMAELKEAQQQIGELKYINKLLQQEIDQLKGANVTR